MNQLKRDLNRPIKRVSIAVLVLFLVLLVNVNYLQAVEAPSLANRPLNDRTAYNDSQVQRGNIVTADGVTIASSKPSNDGFKYQRGYTDGAVYAPVASAMAAGVRIRLGATYGVATTGVAGPEPADGQPVGTVHIAVSAADDTVVRTVVLTGDRHLIRRLTVEHALGLLLGRLREDTD